MSFGSKTARSSIRRARPTGTAFDSSWKVPEATSIPQCGSVRWITAQWKYDIYKKGSDPSPILAQRFDNGVLHVTVEDGLCRCMIAKAPGDPDAKMKKPKLSQKLEEVEPLQCLDPQHKSCIKTRNVRLLALGKTIPELPDPKEDWVRMTYLVSADGNKGTSFDVYANGQFIVRAVGAVPAYAPFPNYIKFKFGHYRDQMPKSANLLVDEVCVSENVASCDKSITTPVP